MDATLQAEMDRGKYNKSKRGSVNNGARLEAFTRQRATGGADWAGCNPELIQAVVSGITVLGGAVTFGMSKDQGAHSVTLLLDGAKATMWFNGNSDLDDELQAVVDTLGQLT